MKIPRLPKGARTQGFTLIELLVVISIIAILAGFAMPALTSAQRRGRITDSLSNAHQISLGLKMFAGDNSGSYPLYSDPPTNQTQLTDSNGAMQLLMPKYSSNKAIFANKNSAWCKIAGGTAATGGTNQYLLNQGECDWSYVAGLSETDDSRFPLLATAFAPGGVTYSTSTSAKGGVWGGTDAVVIFVDGSAKHVANLVVTAPTSFIPRSDVPTANMFTPDPTTSWLDGTQLLFLSPK
jgi:prepilin-type N-terminal cleavage/methylation domain-containing protein